MSYSLRICHKIMVITIILSFTKWSKLTVAIIDFCQNNSDVTTPHSREVGSGARDYCVPPDKKLRESERERETTNALQPQKSNSSHHTKPHPTFMISCAKMELTTACMEKMSPLDR